MSSAKRGNWSVQELERLEVLYPRCSDERVSELLGRSVASVRRRARDLFGRRQVRDQAVWTHDDDQVLRAAYGVQAVANIALVLGRSVAAVTQRVERLRCARRGGAWSRTELALLKQLYGSRSDEDLEVCLSRSCEDIEQAARELCLSKDKRFLASGAMRSRMPRWSAEEVQRLRLLYPDRANLEIARELGRSVASVANKANQLRLKKSPTMLERMGRDNVAARYER